MTESQIAALERAKEEKENTRANLLGFDPADQREDAGPHLTGSSVTWATTVRSSSGYYT